MVVRRVYLSSSTLRGLVALTCYSAVSGASSANEGMGRDQGQRTCLDVRKGLCVLGLKSVSPST